MTTAEQQTAVPDTGTTTSGAEAIREALATLLHDDERVILFGEDIATYGGAFSVTDGLVDRFGADRVRDTPISEEAIIGAGIGAALTGLLPIVEMQFSDFIVNAMDQVVNQAAKIHYMLGGVPRVPLVIRLPHGAGTGAAAQHSQSLEGWFIHVPGLKVVMPSSPSDARDLLFAAVADPNPVLFFEHKLLYREREVMPEFHGPARLSEALVRRHGPDATIVATGIMVSRSLKAAEILEDEEHISVSVVDPRTLKPLDDKTIIEEVTATGRALIVQEAPPSGGFAAEVAAMLSGSSALYHLLAPIRRLCGLDAPIPYAPNLERSAVPQIEDIVAAATELVPELVMHEVALRMPKLTMTMEQGDLASWERAVGDEVHAGDVVCTIVTDKTEMEVEAPVDGRLARIVASPGDTVAVGDPICYFESESESFMDSFLDAPSEAAQVGTSVESPLIEAPVAEAETRSSSPARSANGIVPAVPVARRRARALGVVLASITGSGPGGVVTLPDVEAAAAAPAGGPLGAPISSIVPGTPPVPGRSGTTAVKATSSSDGRAQLAELYLSPRARSIHRSTVDAMTASAAVPQFTVYRRVALDAIAKRRNKASFTVIFAAAFAAALRQVPRLNGTYDHERGVLLHDQVRLAIAIDTDDGLVAPVLVNPDTKDLGELSEELAGLVARAKEAKLRPEDFDTPTATLSNLGPFGVEVFQALLTPPQAVALSIGAAKREIVAEDNGFSFRLACWVGLTCDHRVGNGADAARALGAFAALLEAPPSTDQLFFGPHIG